MANRSRSRGASRSRGSQRGGGGTNPRDRIHSAPTITNTDLQTDYLTRCEKWSIGSESNFVINQIIGTLGEFQSLLAKGQMSRSTLYRLVVLLNLPNFTEYSLETVLSINDIFCLIINSKFVTSKDKLLKLLAKTLDELKANFNIESAKFVLERITNLLTHFVNKFPNEHVNYSHCISHLFERISTENFSHTIPSYEIENIHNLNSRLNRAQIPKIESYDNYELNFRLIDIFPNFHEIEFPTNTKLKSLIREGEYKDTESYLDIHFKLLREDMVYPLKTAMGYLVNLDENYANALFTYDRVRIIGITTLRNQGVVYKIIFTPYGIQNIKHYNWERSDRLKYGSLLCLSTKNQNGFPTFKDPLWAIVISQEIENNVTHLLIKFKNGFEERFAYNTDYFMIESREIYFEAYSHTLSVLQDTSEDTLPFLDILLGKTNTCEPPEYIDEYTVLNLGDLAAGSVKEFHVFDEWPECVDLNDSQFRALKYAFSSRVALIQGPPGTGKTHVGLSIMKILLRTRVTQMNTETPNINLKETLCNQPILILTQSNHVLDQFLELIMCEDMNIIRIGSRSESEKIKPHTLPEVRRYFWKGQNPSLQVLNLRNSQTTVINELTIIEKIIKRYARELEIVSKSSKIMISEEVLRIIASKEHFKSLYNTQQVGFTVVMKKRQSMCDIWLRELGVQCKLFEVLLPKEIPLEKNPFAIIAGKDLTIPDGKIIDKYLILERRIEYLELSENVGDEEATKECEEPQINIPEDPKVVKERKILAEAAKKFKKAMKENKIQEDIPEHILQTNNIWLLEQQDRELLYKFWVKRLIYACGLVVKSYSEQYASKIKQLEIINTSIDLYILQQATVVGMTTTGAARNSKLIRKLKPKIILVDEAGEVLEAHIITSLCQTVEHLILIGDPLMLKPSTAVSRLSDQYNLNLSLFERLIINHFRHATLTLQHRMRPEISSLMRLIYPMLVDNNIVMNYEHIRGTATNMYFVTHGYFEDPLLEDSTSRANTHEAKFVVELTFYLLGQNYRQEDITILTFYNGQKYLIEDLMAKKSRENQVTVSTVDKFQGEESEIVILSVVRGNKENYIGHCCVDNRVCVAFSRAKSGFFVIGNEKCFRVASKKTKSGLWDRIFDRFSELNCIGSSLELYCKKHGSFLSVANWKDFKKIDKNYCFKSCESTTIKRDLSLICNKSKACGHACLGAIGKDCVLTPCTFYKSKQLICGHELKFFCSLPVADSFAIHCKVKCNLELKCGHECQGMCFLCKHGNHLECTLKCTRKLICNHDCSESCHYPYECPPCRKIVSYKCEHLHTSILCGDARFACLEMCEWKCEHLDCPNKCFESCEKAKCNERCSNVMKCGHQCLGICGEACPNICRKCKSFDDNFQIYFGDEKNAFANFIVLEDCGHIFEVLGLDRHIRKSLKNAKFNVLPQCPKCNTFILSTKRYRKTVNEILLNIERVKSKIAGDTKKIISENIIKLRLFLSQNISYNHILENLEKTPIFKSLQELNFSHTNLYIFSEILRMLIGLFTQDYPLEVLVEESPIIIFFHSEELDFLLNISPKDTTSVTHRTLTKLQQMFRLCPLYTYFKLVNPGKLEFGENALFIELRTKFESNNRSEELKFDENFIISCEAFLYTINEKYTLNFPNLKHESFRRKVPNNAMGWEKCEKGHLTELFANQDTKCPKCLEK